MAYQRSILQYWNGSAWTTAYVSGSVNALISVELRDVMGSPRGLIASLSNRSATPFNSTEANRKGPLTGLFTDFMPIRVRDEESGSIMWVGRVYKTKEVYDRQYGSVIEITGHDALAELRDNVTDGSPGFTVTHTASSGTNIGPGSATDSKNKYYTTGISDRSGIIKSFIRLFSRTGNIVTDDTDRFNESTQRFRASGKYELGTQSQKSPLAHIAGLASTEPQNAGGSSFTYDYYLDPNFTSVASSHKPGAFFNYHSRGVRPHDGYDPEQYGFKAIYPQGQEGSPVVRDGRTEIMLSDFDFERPKEDLFSDAVIHYVDAGTADGEENEVVEKTIRMELWKIKSLTSATGFTCYPNQYNRSLLVGDTIELANGTDVGIIQYLSATSGGSDSSPEYALVSDVNTSIVETAGTVYRSATTTSAQFTLISRQSAAYGLNRTFRTSASNETRPDQLREHVASRLMRTASQVVRGSIKVLTKPHFYVDRTVSGVAGAVYSVPNPKTNGFKKAMSIVKLDANDQPTTTYGYSSAVSTTSVTVDSWSTGSVSQGDKIRLYIPIRVGDLIFVQNDLVGVNGMKSLVTNITYSEQPGVASTSIDLVGSESRDEGGWVKRSMGASIANAVNQKVELPKKIDPSQQPKGNQTQSTDLRITGTTSTSSTAHRHVKWSYDESGSQFSSSITTADGVTANIAGGGDTNNDDTGSYAIYGGSTVTELSDNTTYYAFVDFGAQKGNGVKQLYFTTTAAIMADENRIPLAVVTVTTSADGSSPSITPIGSGSFSVNGFDLVEGSIKAEYIKADVIDAEKLVADAITVKHTITGSTIRTHSASNTGIKLNDSSNGLIQIFSQANIGYPTDSNAAERLELYDSGGTRRVRFRTYQNDDSSGSGHANFAYNPVVYGGYMVTFAGSSSSSSTAYGFYPQNGQTTNLTQTVSSNYGQAMTSQSTHAHLGYVFSDLASSGEESFWGTDSTSNTTVPANQVFGWGGLLLVGNDYNTDAGSPPSSGQGYRGYVHIRHGGTANYKINLPNHQPAVGKVLEVESYASSHGVAVLKWADNSSGGASTTNHLFTSATSSGSVSTNSYGVFRYTSDGGGGSADTLAFLSGQTSATPSTGTDQSSFWTMLSESNRLILEPIVGYSGSNNAAWIGYHNSLVGIDSYYHRAGNGTAADPTFNFYGDPDTGFYRGASDQIYITTGGTLRYLITSAYIRPNASTYNLGASFGRWGTIYLVSSPDVVSDIRIKENIVSMTNGLDIINALQPIEYTRIPDESKKQHFGFSAQHVKEVMLGLGYDENTIYSETTSEDANDTQWGISLSEIIAPLVSAVQELSEKIKKLEEKE